MRAIEFLQQTRKDSQFALQVSIVKGRIYPFTTKYLTEI